MYSKRMSFYSSKKPKFITAAGFFFVCMTILVSVLLSGCMAAYNTRTNDSPSGKYAVLCYVRGAPGRSYVAETKKKVVVSIYLRGGGTSNLLFEKQYMIRGSAIEWKSTWDADKHLSLVFYDDGPNVDAETNDNKRILHSINYTFDPETGNVKEESATTK